jgi:hypothetical protein
VNDAPVASNDSNTTSRNTNVTTFVLANDTDIDHTLSQLSVTWITSITGGTASIVGTGVLFTPTAWVCGTGTFTYRALDASGSLSNTATGTITISCTNSAPVANNDTPSVTEDSISNIFSILSNDTDSDIGDTLSISGIIATTSNGTLTTSGTTQVVYTPDANFCGTDTFTYRARDSFWPTASNTATGTITVTCVNDAPVANNDIRTATGTEDTLLTIFVTANDTDIDNAITSITGLTQPSTGGTLSITWGVNVLYTPTANFCTSTPLTFTYRALDASSSQSNIATGSFIVSCVNDAPVASNDSNTTSRNTNVTTFVLANDTDIDHTLSQLSVTWITSITGGTASIVGTGVLFTPTAWVCGTGTFTYRALDASGSLSNTATGTITISCTNSAPVANNDTPSVTEDSISNIFSILSNDTDSDIGDTLSISGIIATTSNGTLTTSGTTQVVYTPDANFCGTDTFTYRARDSFWPTASNTATGTITVTCVNDAPVANNDIRTATGTEDTLLTIFVTANDTDIDNAITSITGLTQPSTGGTLSITWGVNVLYTPTANFCTSTPLTFTYRALDASSSQSNIATGSFIVSCVNDAPVASNDSNTTSRNTNVTTFVLANDTDIDHTLSQLSVTWITSITGGTASIVGTGVLFTPTAWVCGTGTFTYRALDASGSLSNTATGTITISCTNSAPVANNDTPSVTEDSISNIFSILSNDTDSDIGDTLSISGIIATTSNGTLTTSGTTQVVYTPDANFCGTDTFTYRARDSFWPTASNTATGTITVTCVNDAPVANNDIRTATGTEDTLLTIFVTANDTDIDNAITSITGLTQPSTGGTLSITWGVNVLYTPTANFCTSTPLTFTYRALDASSSQSNIATGSFIVSCVNDAPVASNDSNTTSRNTNVTTFVLANDTDIDHTLSQLSVTWITSITGGTASIVGTGVLFTPTAWVCGTGTFTYRALDASGSLSNTATGTITISCTNSAPVANNDTPSVTEDSISNIFSILSNDTDSDIGDTLSISGIIATTSNGTLTTSGTTQVVYTPDANFCGTDTFTYRARDSFWPTASNTATGTITVTCVNDAPVANNDIRTATGTEDTLLTIFVTANDTDIDNAITSITGLTQPSTGGTLSITWGVNVLYTPTANFCTSTPLTFTYRALDASSSQSNIATGSFIVSCVNDAPVASNDSNTTSRNTNVTTFVLANDTDIDHTLSQLSVTWITSITGGTASIVGTGVLFTPTAWVCGTGTFTYRALDASGSLSNTATGTITISCTNSAPVANNDTPSVTEDSISNIFSILSNDTDSDIGDTLSISGIIATTSNGTLTTSGTTQVVYTPDANFCGTDTFTYRARDSFWPTASNTATGTITVTCVNDAPVANNDIRTATGTEDTLLTIFVTANDTDIDNAITSITGLTQPSTGGTLSITWGVNVLYTPTANFCTSTPLTFTYRALDASSSQSNIATGSFIVSCVNDAPVASNDSNTTSRNTNVTTFVLANDTDIDHTLSQLSVTWITSITGGTASIVGTGVLFTPTAWVCGTGTFTYRALDASGSLSNTATGTITISCTNSAPVANNDTPSVTEDSISNIFSILSNDTDSDIGDTLSISGIIATTSNGTLTTSGTTQVVYTPDANFCGTDTFTYRARDSFWPTASNTATGTITVTCVNDAPVANNDIRTATGTEDTLLTIFVTANDTDIDNAITSITGLTQPSTGGTLSITWGVNVLYTPTANFCTSTPLTFTYRALDASSSQSNIATGSFIVSCVNDAPVASNDSNTTSRNTNVTTFVLANDTDIDHTLSQLSVTWITSITGGTASIVGTGVLFTPTAWVCGTGTFTYRALDASGSLSNTATGTITISCTNSAPVANNDTPSVTEDSISNIFSILSNDTDSDIGDTLSISGIIATTSNGTLTTSGTTQVVYTPDANFCGTDTFTYRARDSFWPTASNTATGTITVTCVNDAPVANNDIRTATGTEDSILTIAVLSNDTDSDNLPSELSLTGLTQVATGGTLTISGATHVLYTPTANFCSATPLTFTYRTEDIGNATSNIATGSFIVNCVNDAPVALDDIDGTMRNVAVLVDVLSNDTDSDNLSSELSITGLTNTVLGTVITQSGKVRFTPSVGLCGTGSFDYQTADTDGGISNTATALITINCVNDAPVANADSLTVAEDASATTLDLIANDTDSDGGDTLSISGIINTTANGTLTVTSTTEVSYTPDLNFCGTDTFTYRARDSFWPTASNTATGTITVTCVNDAPVANNDIRTATGTEDSILTIAVLSNDTDSDNLPSELSLTGLTQVATGGTLTISGATHVLYTPTANFCSATPLTFTYRTEDIGNATSNIATGSFIVNCVNDAPVALDDIDGTMRNVAVLVDVLSNDTDSDNLSSELSITGLTNTVLGTVITQSGKVRFTPSVGLCGTGSFDYQTADTDGGISNTATALITINCVNDAPVANADSLTVAEDASATTLDLIANDTDSDGGDTLSISGIINTTANGTLTVTSTTEVSYTPDLNFCGTDTFTYRARDSFWPTASNTATGTITVTCVNDAPVANNDIRTATGTEDSILTIAVLSNDTDSDNLPSELSLTGLTQVATGGTLTISGATHVLYTPTANFCSATPLTFTYRTEDIGNATSNIATGSFIVNCVNDAPVALDDIDGTMRNVAVLVDVLSNDTDSDNLSSELSITGLTNTVLGTVITQSGKVRFTPSVGLCGTGSFDYQTADTDGGISNTATALITINCVNDAPVANADSLTVAEDASATTLDLIANDTDSDGGDTLSISGIINTTANGTLTVTSTTEVSYTPDLNFCGTDTFTYRARDSFWPTASNTATGTITVTCVNDAPVANNDIRTATGTEDSILTIAVLSNDTDSDNLPSELSLTGLTQVATGGTLTISGATHVLYTPTANFCSATPLTFTYRTEDIGNATSNIATGSFIVNCVNDAPVALDDIDGTMRNVAVLVDVLSNDTDSDNLSSELSITGLTNTVLGTVITQSGKVRFTPSVGLCGTGSFDYQTADTDGGISNTATALITINCVNDAPVANADSLTVAEDASATTLDLIANDTDSDGGDTLSISGIINTTANGTLTVTSTTEVSYTPDLNFCGTDTFTYRARDSFWPTASNTATGTITVTCVNDAPVANNDIRTATGTEDSILTIAVLSNDTDSDNLPSELSLTGLTQVATGGTLTISGATHVLYTPTANFCSATPLTFTYRTEDIGNATSNIATGSFIVNCVNDAPVALDDIDGTMRNVAVLVDVLSNDTDSDNLSSELSITGLTNTVLGTVITQSGKVRFTPSVGLCGTGSFDYQTADTDGGISNTATALITINCVNDAPVANADSLTVAEDASATTLDLIANDTDSDGGDTLSISGIINTTANGTLTVTSTTEVSYTPDLNFCGTDTFTYRARDSFWPTASNTATGTITVTCVNDAPVANNDIRTATGTEDSILTIAVLSNDTDSDNLPSELSLTGLTQVATGGTLTISGATHVLYTPTANFCSATPLTFTYRTEDIGNATSNIATGSFIVNCVNDAPVALDDIDGTMRNVAVLVDVLSNDTDSDNLSSELSITGLTNTVLGTVITQSGKVRFTPSVGLCGTGSFDYQTADTDGGISNTATALITINCVNDAPVANADSLTVAEDASATTLDLIANDTDSDGGDTLSISGIINTTANGTLTVTSTTEVSYTPDLNFCGTDTFTYRARDSFWPTASNTATGTITVTCVNDAPVANNDIRTATGTEDSILTIAVLSNDTDSDNLPSELSLTGLTQVATGGTLTISGATHVLYTPTANFCSATPLTFTYRTEDIGNATSNIATGSFIVNCVNDAPVALDDIDGTMRNVAVLVDVLSNDTDSDNLSSELSITGLTNTVLGTVITQSGKVRFTPSVGLCGTGSFDYQTADTDGGISNTATALITINCVNDAPVANADSLTVAEDASATTLDLIANDTDSDGGDTLSISGIINTTANGTLTVTSTTEVSYTPDLNFCGTDTFTYRARDSFWPTASNTATGTITVTCVNDAPVANNDIRTATGTEDSILTIAVLSNDTDSDNLPSELSLTGLTQVATGGTLTISGATHVLYTPTANFCSATPLTFTYRTEDIGNATSNIATGSFIVNCVNDAPVALDDIDGTMRNVAVLVDVLSNDTDSDNLSSELSITGLTNTVLGTVITQSGKVRFTPSVGLCGTGSFDYQTADTDGGISNTATALITINCVNDAPVANADSLTVAEDASATTLDLIANDTDSDGGDTLSISGIINTTANGTLTVTSTTEVSYTPDLNFCGTDTFTYRARDSFWPTASNTATGTITVTCVNDAPVANNDIRTATGTEDSILTIAVLSNDTDSDNLPSELSLTGLTQVATGGTLTISGATHVLYTPTANFCSATPLTFTYRTEDIGNATSNIATGSFIVNCVNDAPVALDDIDGTMRNVAVLVDVLSNDTDSDNLSSELSITGLTNTVLGTVITQSGKVRFTPSVGLCGTGSFDYQTADTDGGISNTATALITINCVNDAPVANADSLTVAEDASATTLDLIANDTDSDGGDTLSISGIINTTANGTLTVTSTTEVSYTPDLNFCGTDTFTYRARDSFWPTASNTATGTITVTCVNDAPVANNDIRTATGTEDSILTIAVLSNDTDSDNLPSELSLTGLTQVATGGTLTISGATHVLYTPTANFCSATPLTFTYRTEDIGNATSNIATGSFIVNCVPPDSPTILTLGNDNHFPFTISDATPIMSWTGEANTIVNYYTSSWVLIATWATDSNGEFVMPILLPLPEGEFTYIITLTDIYGYESSGTILQFLLDTTAPWIPTVQPLPLVSITGSVSVSWSTSPNSSIEILSASWNVLCSTQSTSTGFYSCWPLIPPPLTGTHSLIVRACDNVITPNCSSNLSTQLVVDTLLWSTGAAHPWSNWSSSASSSSFTPSSTPNVSPSVFAPLFTIPEALPDILESAPDIFKDNFLKLLPTQTLVNLDSSMRDGYSVYNLSERVTPYVCPQIVQMYKEDELLANDIPTVDFTDDVKALIMFRWLEKNERVIGQKYSEYQKFGIALNDESYEPYRSITRAEFVKMLVRSLSCRYMFVGTDTKFSDVNRDMWYAEYIAFAVENEWINGYSDGTFRPDALITRAEAAKILARSIKLRISPRTISTFIDVPNSSVFVPYIESLRDSNIINGKTLTTFEPNSHVVRTEASRIIYKTFLGWWRKVSEK